MVSKQLMNPLQAWTSGATWGTPSGDNEMTQEVAHLLNDTGITLYTGDIVCVDVTGTKCELSANAADPRVIGVVGGVEIGGSAGSTNTNFFTQSGGAQPTELAASVTANMGFTNGSATVTYASAAAVDLGKQLFPAYNSSTNATPAVYTIIAVSVGTGYTVSATFSGTTGTFSTQMGNAPGSLGPGWGPDSAFPVGVQVPILTRGVGRININGVAGAVAQGLISTGNGTVIGVQTLASTPPTVGQIGTFIGVLLEAYAARDTNLNTVAGISGHDSCRALIAKF